MFRKRPGARDPQLVPIVRLDERVHLRAKRQTKSGGMQVQLEVMMTELVSW